MELLSLICVRGTPSLILSYKLGMLIIREKKFLISYQLQKSYD